MRHTQLIFVLVLFIVFSSSLPGSVQEAPVNPPAAPPSKAADKDSQLDRRTQEPEPSFTAEQLKALNKRRQETLKKDTDKLLELATELKMYVDKSNENTLSVEVVKKAEAIEKLARSVKDKMKGM